MKVFTSKTQKTGEIGEKIAEMFLVKHDFVILERNHTKKWGEIDIIALKDKKLHFIEVKSVSHETTVSPEDNLTPQKLKKLYKTIEVYLMSLKKEQEWQLDLACVYLNHEDKTARVKLLENIY